MVPTIHPEPDRVLFPWLMAIIQGGHPWIQSDGWSAEQTLGCFKLFWAEVRSLPTIWWKKCAARPLSEILWNMGYSDIFNINGWAGFLKHQQYPGDSSRDLLIPQLKGHGFAPFFSGHFTIPKRPPSQTCLRMIGIFEQKKLGVRPSGHAFFWWHQHTKTLLSFCWQFWELAHVSWDSFLLGLLFVYALLSSTLF